MIFISLIFIVSCLNCGTGKNNDEANPTLPTALLALLTDTKFSNDVILLNYETGALMSQDRLYGKTFFLYASFTTI